MKHFFLKILQTILRSLASLILKTKKPEIIAVTGSVAKSTTKEAIYQVLSKRLGHRVAKSEGNLNNEIGLPLAVLGFKRSFRFWEWPFVLIWAIFKIINLKFKVINYPKTLVLEMAADKPGDIGYLVSFAPPKIAIVTAVGHSHLEAFGTIDKVAEEKAKIVEVLSKSGFAILNKKDPKVAKMAQKTKATVLYFTPENLNIPQLVAKKIGEIYNVSEQEIQEALQTLKPLKGRMNLKKGIKRSRILDDSYNSNPLSAAAALDFLAKTKGERKIAVLGDMLELGDYTERGHRQVGQKAKETADLLLATGEQAKMIAKEGEGLYFKTKKELIDFLKKEIKEGDIILVKASRAMEFEEIVGALRA